MMKVKYVYNIRIPVGCDLLNMGYRVHKSKAIQYGTIRTIWKN